MFNLRVISEDVGAGNKERAVCWKGSIDNEGLGDKTGRAGDETAACVLAQQQS